MRSNFGMLAALMAFASMGVMPETAPPRPRPKTDDPDYGDELSGELAERRRSDRDAEDRRRQRNNHARQLDAEPASPGEPKQECPDPVRDAIRERNRARKAAAFAARQPKTRRAP